MEAIILPYKNIFPTIAPTAWIAPTAAVIGDVHLGENVSVWFGAVVRGDVNEIRIGNNANIQDGAVIHVTTNGLGTYVAEGVTIGHRAILHATKVGPYSLIGMGAILLDGSDIPEECLVGAGTLVTPGQKFPPRSLIVGQPAKVKRALNEEELKFLRYSAHHYVEVAGNYQ